MNKSPGPDGYTFEFFRRYWRFIGSDFCSTVECFFESGYFPKGSNSSLIALIPKVTDAKFVTDFKPISLIGSVYNVVTKILANRLVTVISDLVFDIQLAFVANRQILDGSFILNELLAWCKRKKKQAMIFKVDFAMAYDSVHWDYLWLMGALLLNSLFCGLKQGDPLAPYLFILIMESLHISFSRATSDGLFKEMEAIRCNFFNGADHAERKITWVSWDKVLASKKNGDGSLWYRVIQALYGASFELHPVNQSLIWCFILREMQVLISKGFDFVSHCKKRVEDGHNTRFWYDSWFFDQPLRVMFPYLFALETDKESTVASKLGSSSVDASFRRSNRDRVERQQWDNLNSVSGSVTLSASKDRWICDLNGDGVFRVKEVHIILDDIFLPSTADDTR
nr:RNA-directed DNA polymerase, eukaryota, reverse transcriptase zinc-binding domain protein [Tanacetum cinerariifolium]